MRSAIALVLLLLAAAASLAYDFDLPKPTGYVTDQAGVLSGATKQRLVDLNRELEQKTGAQIAVVIVPTTKPEPPFDFALAIAEAWKPGSTEKDNGVVFLVATEDRQMQILTGYGAEGPLPDGLVGEIRDRIIGPAFRRGDFDAGILGATTTMASLLAKDAGVTLDGVPPPQLLKRRRSRRLFDSAFPSVLLLVLFLLMRLTRRGGGRRGRRGADAYDAFLLGSLLGRGFPHGRHGGFGGGGFGGGFGGGGGGFGGFGGGGFGGGGAGGSW